MDKKGGIFFNLMMIDHHQPSDTPPPADKEKIQNCKKYLTGVGNLRKFQENQRQCFWKGGNVVIKMIKIYNSTEVEQHGTSRAENLYLTWSLYSK